MLFNYICGIILGYIEGDFMHDDSLIEKYLEFAKRWSFDKDYLRDVIILGKKKLENKNLSRRKRQSIRIDIDTFERFLLDDFELKSSDSYAFSTPNNIDKLKDYILVKMKKQYDMFGVDAINFIIDLNDTGLFEESKGISDITELSISEWVELIIKNYEKNLPKFVLPAREILLDDEVKQIQLIETEDSYCHYDYITDKSYILVNMTDAPCIFNHEVEHAIEEYFRYHTNYLYDELGAILNEMLFNEELYKLKGCLFFGDYDFRIDESAYLLNSVCDYFKVLLYFATRNFDVSTNEFVDTFVKYGIVDENNVLEYLSEDIATNYMEGNMGYLFSFLKAVELRELFINSNRDAFYILEYYLKNKKFVFRKPKDGFMLYNRYIDDVKSRVRKK